MVGVCLARSADTIVALLGILKAGAAYVPLDPSYPGERLAFMIDRLSLETVVTTTTQVDALPYRPRALIMLDEDPETVDTTTDEYVDASGDGETLAYVLFTSGTTGDQAMGVPHQAITDSRAVFPTSAGTGRRVLRRRRWPSTHRPLKSGPHCF
jgi:non-ribosomal peptide synthetase component F